MFRKLAAECFGTFWLVFGGGGRAVLSALVVELVLSAGFLLVIHGATDQHAPAGFAPIAIGLALTLIHLISFR